MFTLWGPILYTILSVCAAILSFLLGRAIVQKSIQEQVNRYFDGLGDKVLGEKLEELVRNHMREKQRATDKHIIASQATKSADK